jgi:hypothetical protein
LFFSDIGYCIGVWHIPFLHLGTLLLRRKLWVFRIPRRLSHLCARRSFGDGPPPELVAWLESLGHEGAWPPPIDYDPVQDFGWSLVDVDVIHRVKIQITESSTKDCGVEIIVESINNDAEFWKLPDVIYYGPVRGDSQGSLRQGGRMNRIKNAAVAHQSGFLDFPDHGDKAPYFGLSWPLWMEHVSEQESGDKVNDNWIRAVLDMAHMEGVDAGALELADGQPGEFIGYVLPCADEGFAQIAFSSGWVEQPSIAELVLETSNREFHPTFAVPEEIPAPAIKGSIAAAILRNLGGAAASQRIDTMLIERADLIAKAGLGYYERLMQFHRERLQHPS